MKRGDSILVQCCLIAPREAIGEVPILAVTTLAAGRNDLVRLSMVVSAACKGSAKLEHREISERASALVVPNLIQQLRPGTEGLIEIARDTSHGLEHCQVGTVHPRRAMPG